MALTIFDKTLKVCARRSDDPIERRIQDIECGVYRKEEHGKDQ
jgi:hypothetical protein